MRSYFDEVGFPAKVQFEYGNIPIAFRQKELRQRERLADRLAEKLAEMNKDA